MPTKERTLKAFGATRALGIPDEEVRPVLNKLLELFNKNWGLIEEEDYRALIDAYFEFKDNQGTKDDKGGMLKHDDFERPSKKLCLVEKRDRGSLRIADSRHLIAGRDTGVALACSKKGKKESDNVHSKDHRAPHHLDASSKGKEPSFPPMAPKDKNLTSGRGSDIVNKQPLNTQGCSSKQDTLSSLGKRELGKPNFEKSVTNSVSASETKAVSSSIKNKLITPKPREHVVGLVCSSGFNAALLKRKGELTMPKSEQAVIDSARPSESNTVSSHSKKNLVRQQPITNSESATEPDAVGHPGGRDLLVNSPSGNHYVKSQSSRGAHIDDEVDPSRLNDSSSSKNIISIASSALGEVKLFLNCKSALRKPRFKCPNMETVTRFLEDKYHRSENVMGRQFSVRKLLKDLCDSYLKLGNNSASGIVVKNCSNGEGVSVENCISATGLNERASRINYTERNSNKTGGSSHSAAPITVHHQPVTCDKKRPFRSVSDITKGAENLKISLVAEVGSEKLPKFTYIPHNIVYQSAYIHVSLARISDEDCCSSCSGDCLSSSIPCACARETGGEFAYTQKGVLKEEFLKACMPMEEALQKHRLVYCQDCPLERLKNEHFPERCRGHIVRKFIKECWRKCGCDMKCGNRVVQRGISCKLQVFLTGSGKGWGLRPLENLPKGAFVCEYVGEILTNTELYDRNQQNSGNERHTYPVTLDADWGSEKVLKDEEALCLDATFCGNVARFINHRCSDANLIDIPVEVETPDRHYYHLAFFTVREVKALEELSWDYGIDFEDHNHPIKAFQCCCGSAFCRDVLRKKKKLVMVG